MRHLACITCGKEKLTRSAQKKALCQSCCKSGKKHSEEWNQNISNGQIGRIPGMLGKHHTYESKLKSSMNQTGRIRSDEERKSISLSRGGTGELNRIYPGIVAWSSRNRLKTPFCEWCYSEDNLEAHHILPKARFPQYATDDSNCRVMCAPCHITCHKQGGF